MKNMRKFISFVLSFVCILATITVVPVQTQAAEYTEEPIIYDVEYTGTLDGDTNPYNEYLLSVPSDGKMMLKAYHTGEGLYGIPSKTRIQIFDKDGVSKVEEVSLKAGSSLTPQLEYIVLKKGVYKLRIALHITGELYGDGDYFLTCSYNFDSSTNAKVSSPKKGALKVTAPKGSVINGFEVRYKKSGAATWTVKTIEGNKNLNKTFTGLKSKAKYTVQTRKYVKDIYGYTYYANWTKAQSVNIK